MSGGTVPTAAVVLHEGRSRQLGDWNEWTMKFGTDPWSGEERAAQVLRGYCCCTRER